MFCQGVIDHVFLPRKLPEIADKTEITKNDDDEEFILETFAKVVKSMAAIPLPVKGLFAKMETLHCGNKKDYRKLLQDQLRDLSESSYFGIYIEKQNCALLLRGLSDRKITFATFRTSLPNEIVYGENVQHDMQVKLRIIFSNHRPYRYSSVLR